MKYTGCVLKDKEPRGIIPLENLSIREVDDSKKPVRSLSCLLHNYSFVLHFRGSMQLCLPSVCSILLIDTLSELPTKSLGEQKKGDIRMRHQHLGESAVSALCDIIEVLQARELED